MHRRAVTCNMCQQRFFPASIKFHVKVQQNIGKRVWWMRGKTSATMLKNTRETLHLPEPYRDLKCFPPCFETEASVCRRYEVPALLVLSDSCSRRVQVCAEKREHIQLPCEYCNKRFQCTALKVGSH